MPFPRSTFCWGQCANPVLVPSFTSSRFSGNSRRITRPWISVIYAVGLPSLLSRPCVEIFMENHPQNWRQCVLKNPGTVSIDFSLCTKSRMYCRVKHLYGQKVPSDRMDRASNACGWRWFVIAHHHVKKRGNPGVHFDSDFSIWKRAGDQP